MLLLLFGCVLYYVIYNPHVNKLEYNKQFMIRDYNILYKIYYNILQYTMLYYNTLKTILKHTLYIIPNIVEI
jgi:hypothetical protein